MSTNDQSGATGPDIDLNGEHSGPVQITERAAEMVKELLGREGRAGDGLRVWVDTGGCSGMSYQLDFAAVPQDGDLTLEQRGVRLFVDQAAVSYLQGTTIDYVSGLHRAGFRFVNPQASRTCGCGESFSV
jgi:iron-sulfur cluster assembly protein